MFVLVVGLLGGMMMVIIGIHETAPTGLIPATTWRRRPRSRKNKKKDQKKKKKNKAKKKKKKKTKKI